MLPINNTGDPANNTDEVFFSNDARPYYERSSNAIRRVIIAMAITLKNEDGTPLFNEDEEP